MMHLKHLAVRATAVVFMLWLSVANAHATTAAPAIATLDWTLAETLIALGAPPAGLAQIPHYQKWVGAEHIPTATRDIGLRAQPNRELLGHLAPDAILLSPLYLRMSDTLSSIAPVTALATYDGDTLPLWARLTRTTQELAELINAPQAGEALIDQTEAQLNAFRATLAEDTAPLKLLVVQFIDDRHLRIFGHDSLFDEVLTRLGLENAWTGATNQWGFSTIELAELLHYEAATLVVVEPIPDDTQRSLAGNALWQHLPAVRADEVIVLPAVWSFGGFPSAQRFAELLSDALHERSREGDRNNLASHPFSRD